MFEQTESSSLAARRADATREMIVEAAWRLSRASGLTGWSLRELAAAVGVKAPTLYAYVDSKHAIYDQMFREGWEEMDRLAQRWTIRAEQTGDLRTSFKWAMREFLTACSEDPTRYHLLFQRVIPDFEPSEAAYAVAVAYYERFREQMAVLGVTDDVDLDLWTAISTGLTDQQISNDPGGDRWVRLIDTAVDMYCDHLGIAPDDPPTATVAQGSATTAVSDTDRDTD